MRTPFSPKAIVRDCEDGDDGSISTSATPTTVVDDSENQEDDMFAPLVLTSSMDDSEDGVEPKTSFNSRKTLCLLLAVATVALWFPLRSLLGIASNHYRGTAEFEDPENELSKKIGGVSTTSPSSQPSLRITTQPSYSPVASPTATPSSAPVTATFTPEPSAAFVEFDLERNETCRKYFMQGINPRDNRTIIPEWNDNNCDNLFCNETVLDVCEVNRFGIDLLLTEADEVCNTEKADEFIENDFWSRYRLSDIFRGQADLALIDKYPESLMWKYRNRTIDEFGEFRALEWDILKSLVQERASITHDIPPPKTMVIHLREGDVVDNDVNTVEELLQKQHYYNHCRQKKCGSWRDPYNKPNQKEYKHAWNAYVRPLSAFFDLDFSSVENVVIMAAAHISGSKRAPLQPGDRPVKSCRYAYAIKAHAERFNLNVTMRFGGSPDSDLVFGSHASVFVQSGGGYSNAIHELALLLGNQVQGPKWHSIFEERKSPQP